nr:glycosyltransferase family 4 protein [Propionibacteriales bacterium]
MRIAHVSDVYLPQLGGIELHVHDLASRQHRLGHDSVVVTTTPGGPEHSTDAPVHRFAAHGLLTPSATARAIRDAVRLLTARRVDVVHGHVSVISPFAMGVLQAAARTGIPAVVTMHSMWEEFGGVPRWLVCPVGAREWPVVWTAVSGSAATSFARVLGGDIAVGVLPNAVDPEPWRRLASRRTNRSAGPLRVVSVMRLVSRKRPLPLIKIIDRADRALAD